jgi:hypothetical protein
MDEAFVSEIWEKEFGQPALKEQVRFGSLADILTSPRHVRVNAAVAIAL